MKSSRYNISTQNPDSKETILFNTLYGSMVAIDAETLPLASGFLENPREATTKLEKEVMTLLTSGKFIIEDVVDEIAIVRNRKQCGMKDKNRADVIIMPNMDCNFACPYCYEKHDPLKKMTSETEKAIKKWLTKIIDDHKVVLLNWFGGEPLLSYKTIFSIVEHASKRCKEKEVSLLNHITTNGYSFTEEMIGEFVNLEIYNYQITVDGPPETHNRTRILKSGKGSFDKIFSNILALTDAHEKVKISLRINYNHNNIRFIPELLSLFPEKNRKQLRVVYEPIFGDCKICATKNLSGEEISKLTTDYYEIAGTMGYDIILGGLNVGKFCYCYAEREDQYIVNYQGDVFKCSVSDFDSQNRVGFIDESGYFVKVTEKWDEWFNMDLFDNKCESCTFLPICMGGCRKDRLENNATGSYCSLIPTNTSYALKSIAFGNFNELIRKQLNNSRGCAKTQQSAS